MELTLLDMVQSILNDMDADEANSIDDTVESLQVASIVKDSYYKLVTARDDWPFLKTLTTLTGVGDVDNPTKMRIPTGMNKLYWVKYNKTAVSYLDPEEFKNLIDVRTELADVVSSDGYVLNADPTYWTTYDQDYIWFDGIDMDEDTTLQSSKSVAYGVIVPSWSSTDTFIPLLPPKMFPTLLADAKGTAFLTLKQQANPKEEGYANRGLARFQNAAYKANKAEPTNNPNNYGRK